MNSQAGSEVELEDRPCGALLHRSLQECEWALSSRRSPINERTTRAEWDEYDVDEKVPMEPVETS
ncbi:hypothetical protein F7725_007951 [Dissostichus mawsoni]|uniref:Uncharacterized protein n=1 Tax=Dissostichus mawsoni TaxID=36200 RepID=A0A7J5Y8V9_DISMA|nr:hypothetical protein F7725_007951 [Dissostichus mawsoni]